MHFGPDEYGFVAVAGSSSIYAGASSRRSTEPFTRESRKNVLWRREKEGIKGEEIGISGNLIRQRDTPLLTEISKRYDASEFYKSKYNNLKNIINIIYV